MATSGVQNAGKIATVGDLENMIARDRSAITEEVSKTLGGAVSDRVIGRQLDQLNDQLKGLKTCFDASDGLQTLQEGLDYSPFLIPIGTAGLIGTALGLVTIFGPNPESVRFGAALFLAAAIGFALMIPSRGGYKAQSALVGAIQGRALRAQGAPLS